MAYTATKYLLPRPHPFPRGRDTTQSMSYSWGIMAENDTASNYAVGGVGSSSFQVTAFSAVGLVTYNTLVGLPLVNGQLVVVSNTASNTNDGTYKVSSLTTTSSTAGTFIAVPLPGNSLAGSAQTAQTAEGVGQIQWSARSPVTQTFTATAVTVSGTQMTVTYTTLVGPQLQATDQSVILSGMTNAGNNGTFTINSIKQTSSTAGSFIVTNANAVASDSGTGTASYVFGINDPSAANLPVEAFIHSYQKGWVYQFDRVNQTVRIFVTGTSANTVLNEAALGANVAFDGFIVYQANFVKWVSNQFD